jgi:hypothetical protein
MEISFPRNFFQITWPALLPIQSVNFIREILHWYSKLSRWGKIMNMLAMHMHGSTSFGRHNMNWYIVTLEVLYHNFKFRGTCVVFLVVSAFTYKLLDFLVSCGYILESSEAERKVVKYHNRCIVFVRINDQSNYKDIYKIVVIGWYLDLFLSALPHIRIVAALFGAFYEILNWFPSKFDLFMQEHHSKPKLY